MTVESAPSGMSMQVASVEITATPTATDTADIGPSFGNFTPNLSSILESDRFVPGEIVRDFTTKLVSWVPEEPALDQPVGHLPDTVHLPGEVTDETPDSHLGGGLGRPPREVIYLGGGAEESEIKIATESETERIIITAPRVYNVEENYSVRIEAQTVEITSKESESKRNGEVSDVPQARLLGGGAEESKVITVTASAGEQKQAVVEQVDTQPLARKMDQEASLNRLKIAKKAVEEALGSDLEKVAGSDLNLPDETVSVRSKILAQLGLIFDPDGAYSEFMEQVSQIGSQDYNQMMEAISRINSVLPPVELGGKRDEVSEEDVVRVLNGNHAEIKRETAFQMVSGRSAKIKEAA